MGTLTVRSIFIFNYIEDVLFVGYFWSCRNEYIVCLCIITFLRINARNVVIVVYYKC